MTIPAHKVMGDAGKPGQLSFDRYPYLKHSTAEPQINTPKRLTFEEWWEDAQHWVPFEEHPEKAIWKAAQENAPSYRPGAEEKT